MYIYPFIGGEDFALGLKCEVNFQNLYKTSNDRENLGKRAIFPNF